VPIQANLVALDESATNLIDSENYARGWIIPDNQSRDPRRAEPPARVAKVYGRFPPDRGRAVDNGLYTTNGYSGGPRIEPVSYSGG